MANPERKSVGEKVAEFSKKIDYATFVVGSGIVVLFSKPVGMAIIVGSVLTMVPAIHIQKMLEKRRKARVSASA
jgi:hypothetical protein